MGTSQNLLFWFVGLFLAFETYKGWRLGPVRILTRIIGLALAYFVGIKFGASAAPLLRPTGFPDALLAPLASALIGLLTYGIICFIGRVLFKKTSEQEYGLTWFLYGISGGVMGLGFGLFLVASVGVGTRVVGTFASGITAPAKEQTPNLAEDEIPTPPTATAVRLASLKEQLNKGIAGQFLQSIDPIDPETYSTIEKIGRAVSSPLAAQRFLTFPGAIDLAKRPEIQALRDNPEIVKAIQERNFLSLLHNQELVKVVNNPKVKALIQSFDFSGALTHALSPTAPISLPPARPSAPAAEATQPQPVQVQDPGMEE